MSLSELMQDRQTKLFDDTGAFFAFGTKQFNEKKVEGVRYVDAGGGLICPTKHYERLATELELIHSEAMKEDLELNGREGIIRRELSNHEAYYTMDIDQTFDAIKCYGITEEEILKVFNIERLTKEA
jgi:hypothetical protein